MLDWKTEIFFKFNNDSLQKLTMKFASFEIRNFKGIKNIDLDIEKSPQGSIFP
jgi:hypothetical protein